MPKLVRFLKLPFLLILFLLFSLPVLAQEGDILLSDDFNDGNYNGWSVESGSWSVNNGNLFTNQTGVFSFLGEIHTRSDWDNYRIELDVNNERGVDEGIEFRKNGNTHYTFNLRHGTGSFNTPEIKFFKAVNGVDSLLASTHSQQLLNNTWYHLKIEVLNENIKLWVNDTLRIDYTDPGTDLKKGGLGLQSWTGANGFIRLRFDNVKVTALAPPPSSKTPLILIPGIGGSELKVAQDITWSAPDGHGGMYNRAYAKDEVVWMNEPEARAAGDDDYFDVLRMKADGVNPEANLILTNNLLARAYQKAIDFFTSNGYILNKDLFVFPYDWRKDISSTRDFLDQKISQIKTQTGAQKVDIVAHSMGGLVARNYIADPARATNVRKLFTLGTPHLGAVEFLKYLTEGGCLKYPFGPYCLSLAPSEVKDVIQNMISGFELAPTQFYFNFYSGEDTKYPYPYRTELGALNYNQIKNLLSTFGYNVPLFNPSETFHSIDSALSNTNGVDITVVAGSGQSTLGQIIEEKTTSLLGIQGIHKDTININGDNTVPLYSASLNDPGKNYSLLGLAKVYYTKQRHEDLVTNGPTLNLVKNILDNNNDLPSGVSETPYKLAGYNLSTHSPVNLHVYDANGNHTGPTADGFEVNIPGSSYDTLGDAKFIYLPDNGIYNVKFEATDNGSFDFKIRKFENDLNSQTILYKDVPLNNTTKAEATFDTTSIQSPILQIDQDGNGTIDTQTNAFSTLSGDANYDQTPPKTTVSLAGTIGNNGWYKSDVVVTLTAEDQSGSGVQKIEYTLNNSQTVQTYSQPFIVSTEGIIKLKFRSIDKAGNEETPREIEFKIDKTPPLVSIDASPKILWPPNNKMTDVKITGSSTDLNPYSTKITVEDEYRLIEPAITDFGHTIKLQASRNGDDKDSRKYTIKAVAEDLAGNTSQAIIEVIVPHDQGKNK